MTTETAVRRVATYERVSSENQRERATIQAQRDALDRRLATEPDVTLVDRYVDEAVSGSKKVANRPDGGRLLRDAEAHRFDELWVYRLDRLGRDLVDMAIVGRRLRQIGIRLISMTEGEPDPFMFDIMAVIAENEKRVFLERTADGINSAAGEGQYCGGIVPFGYQVQGTREAARLEPDTSLVWADQSAADIVHWIYERLGIDRWSCRRVAEELNARGVPTHYARDGRLVKPKGQRAHRTQGIWRSGRIRNLVVNPVYRGQLQYGRRTSKPRRDREVISAPVEALVSPALWHAAQDTLAANRAIPKNTRRRYLLRGVVRCGVDGLSYCSTQGRGDVGWYRCTGQIVERGPLPGRCWGQSIRTDAIEPQIWADIERWLRDPGEVLADLDGRAERDGQGTVAVAESITLGRALDGLEGQRKQALALNIRGRLGDAELDAELDRIAAEKVGLDRRVAALEPPDAPELPEAAMEPARRAARPPGRRIDRGAAPGDRSAARPDHDPHRDACRGWSEDRPGDRRVPLPCCSRNQHGPGSSRRQLASASSSTIDPLTRSQGCQARRVHSGWPAWRRKTGRDSRCLRHSKASAQLLPSACLRVMYALAGAWCQATDPDHAEEACRQG
jgi:site-specific DNA recombinase